MDPAPKLGVVRRPRAPAAPPPAGGGLPPGLLGPQAQAMPYLPGQVILTPMEKAALKKVGWNEGDPIPANMASLQAGVQAARAAADTLPEMDLTGYKPFEIPQAVEMRDLPRDRQDAIKKALEDAKAQQAQFARQNTAQVDGAGPGVNEAITAGLQSPLLDAPPRAAARPPQPPPEPDTPPSETAGAGGAVPPKLCPHCGWDQSVAEEIEVTAADRLGWLVAQEGRQRFTKEYVLNGGRLVVTFRGLTAHESDMAYRQIAVDATRSVRERAPETEDAYWRNLMTYRLLLSLAKVWTPTAGPIDNPTLDLWDIDPEAYPTPNTKVYAIVGPVTEAALVTESVRRVVGAAHHKFQLLVEKLEAHADDDSFWTGIGRQS